MTWVEWLEFDYKMFKCEVRISRAKMTEMEWCELEWLYFDGYIFKWLELQWQKWNDMGGMIGVWLQNV